MDQFSLHVFALREGQTFGNRTTVRDPGFSWKCVTAAAAFAAALDDNDESPFNVGAGQLAQQAMNERSRKGKGGRGVRERAGKKRIDYFK